MPTSNVIKSSCVDVPRAVRHTCTGGVNVIPDQTADRASLIGSLSLWDWAGVGVELDGAGVRAVAVRDPCGPEVAHVDHITRLSRGRHDDLSGLVRVVGVVRLAL